jgi:hypothetical protein
MTVRPYQRRRRGPIIAVVTVLALLAAATWVVVLSTASTGSGSAACPAPADGKPIGEVLAATALDKTAPVPPSTVGVRVLNAGGQRGQANLVAAQLKEYGFAQAAPPSDDPRYPGADMACVGQVRFGAAGEAAAGTVALVLPCVELVRDGRADPSVDISVGTAFGDLNPPRAALDVLEQLAQNPGQSNDGSANADPAAPDQPAPAPAVDQAELQKARDATC